MSNAHLVVVMLSEEALLFVLFNYGVFYFVMKRWMDVVFSVLFFGVFERSMMDGCCFFHLGFNYEFDVFGFIKVWSLVFCLNEIFI